MQEYKLIWRFCNKIYASSFTVNDDVHNRVIWETSDICKEHKIIIAIIFWKCVKEEKKFLIQDI